MAEKESYIDRADRKQAKRIEAFASLGIKATRGQFLGWVSLSATEADKLLRLLIRAEKARGK